MLIPRHCALGMLAYIYVVLLQHVIFNNIENFISVDRNRLLMNNHSVNVLILKNTKNA